MAYSKPAQCRFFVAFFLPLSFQQPSLPLFTPAQPTHLTNILLDAGRDHKNDRRPDPSLNFSSYNDLAQLLASDAVILIKK
ncbi:hypothetical protein [Aeromonas intestinalis]